MTEKTRLQLLAWAREYHCAAFIQGDPVQFPHRYTQKQDIEVSGLLTAIMSFGNRRQILKKADGLHGLMGASPYRYVLSFGAYRYGNILSEECAEHNRGFGGSLSGRPLFGRFRIVRQRGKRSAVRLGFVLPVYLLNAFAP